MSRKVRKTGSPKDFFSPKVGYRNAPIIDACLVYYAGWHNSKVGVIFVIDGGVSLSVLFIWDYIDWVIISMMRYTKIGRMIWFGGDGSLSVLIVLDYIDWVMISLMIYTNIRRMIWFGGGGGLSVVWARFA